MKKQIIPDKTWDTFNVKVESFCSTLKKARMRAENMNYETTEDEQLGRGERLINNHTLYNHCTSDSSEAEDSTSLSSPPVMSANERLYLSSQVNENDSITVSNLDNNNKIVENVGIAPSCNSVDLENVPIIQMNDIANSLPELKKLLEIGNEILLYVRSIDERLKRIEKNPPVERNKQNEDIIKSLLPIQSVDDMKNFEQIIDDKDCSQNFRNYLGRIGGRSGKESLQRLCKTIFSNKFAVLCSWLGQRGNFAIKDLKTINLMKDVVLNEFSDLKEKEIESHLSEWFRLAKLRLKREMEKRGADGVEI